MQIIIILIITEAHNATNVTMRIRSSDTQSTTRLMGLIIGGKVRLWRKGYTMNGLRLRWI